MNHSGTKPRSRGYWVILALIVALVSQRHRLVATLQDFNFLPGSVNRAEAASARVRPLLTVELGAMNLKLGDPVFLRILKEEQVLEVWMQPAGEKDFVHYKTYVLCRPAGEAGPRMRDGDTQLPEGFYRSSPASLRPGHFHYLAFDTGYPNQLDRFHRRPSGTVLVRGDCAGGGSVALTNPQMEEVYTLVSEALAAGHEEVQIHFFPFRLTDQRLNQEMASQSPWLEYWANLKEGWDYFEIVRQPPQFTVKAGSYSFQAW